MKKKYASGAPLGRVQNATINIEAGADGIAVYRYGQERGAGGKYQPAYA